MRTAFIFPASEKRVREIEGFHNLILLATFDIRVDLISTINTHQMIFSCVLFAGFHISLLAQLSRLHKQINHPQFNWDKSEMKAMPQMEIQRDRFREIQMKTRKPFEWAGLNMGGWNGLEPSTTGITIQNHICIKLQYWRLLQLILASHKPTLRQIWDKWQLFKTWQW